METIKREARERQLSSLKKGNEKPDTQFIEEREQKESAEIIADMFNANKQYIREAEKLKEEKPPHRITPKSDKFRGMFI